MSGCCGTEPGSRWPWFVAVALAFGVALLLGLFGCASRTIRVSDLAPRPVVNRTPSMVDLGLRIENTPDTIHVDKAAHLEIVSVHEALQRAFTAGFGGTAGAAPRTLVVALEGVELVSAMAARASRTDGFDGASIVLVHGGHSPQVFSSPKVKVVRIRFRAALRDGSTVVSQMAGHAHGSSFTSLSVGSASASATAAIEDMYVQIAKQLFERTMASLAHPSAQEARWR